MFLFLDHYSRRRISSQNSEKKLKPTDKRRRNTKKGGASEATKEENPDKPHEKPEKKKGSVTKKRGDNRGSKEPSTAAPSVKHRKEKPSKNKKKKHGTVESTVEKPINRMYAPKPMNPESPAIVPPGPPGLITVGTEDENTTTVKAPQAALGTPPAVDPCMTPEPASLKPKVVAAPHDKSIKAIAANSALTPNSTVSQGEKWPAEETAKTWLDKVSFERTKQEFDKIQAMAVVDVVNECKKWKANGKCNQSADDYPALDANLATVENAYVNMSKIELPPTLRSMFIGQIPVKGNEESFWKVIFDKRITSMHIIALPGEPIDFFPTQSSAFIYYGTMFVNNRRVETVNEDVHRFAIEVLPDGCSNSIICNITIIRNWNSDSVHAKQAIVIKECIDLINFLVGQSKDDNALVVSKHGAGRAGYLVALAVAIHSMDKKTEPSIYDIVKGIRAQRPKAVESVTQYASIYTSMFYYIKKKIARTDGGSVDKKSAESTDPICKKSITLTTLFANALIAEVNAGTGNSTMTMLKTVNTKTSKNTKKTARKTKKGGATEAAKEENPDKPHEKLEKKKGNNKVASVEKPINRMFPSTTTKPESPATVLPGLPTQTEDDNTKKAPQAALVTPSAVDPCMTPEPSSLKPKPHDKSIKAVAANSALTPNSTVSQADKWPAEETAKTWLDKVSFERTKQEFDKIQAMAVVNVANECKKWKANGKCNQSADDYPALDANLATVENAYVNMSKIELPPTLRSMFIGQIPVKGNEESFWKVIFDKRITSMQIIALPGEAIDFFPTQSGVHVYHGTMFVNNRRVETVNEDVHRFAIEVLPDGCSNSIICNITIIRNWNIDSVHAKQAIVIKECIDLINFLVAQSKDDNALVVSKHGAGRAGYLVALAVAIHSMDKKTEPSIYDIVKGIRAQRPKAVESVTQYASIYTSMFYYIKKKIARTDGGSVDKKSAESNDPIIKKSITLTTLFANALIAEVNAGDGNSTMTMLK
ncbi:hypothetical protein CAEBREN_30380 [Caenorhabditis brenneri]|uniref:Tyrosine-protein phosphatase domain-containing protein n=1 Tax=Caenorhabditis brenneri TaxID=135651 RepID=G0N2I4_CAEBE|nr:hypothetical protein CAEBREN_30380 [Caenorhabditis brenneri]